MQTAALSSSQLMNFANIASDIGVSQPTVKEYYQILEDTLIGFSLFPWRKGKGRKAIASSKFYFFDTGVVNTILNRPLQIDIQSDSYGYLFEQFIAQEIRAYISYNQKHTEFQFWRSLQKDEVDFILNDCIAIEVKTSKKVKKEHLTGLKKITSEAVFKERILVTFDKNIQNIEGIKCWPWNYFLDQLWSHQIID